MNKTRKRIAGDTLVALILCVFLFVQFGVSGTSADPSALERIVLVTGALACLAHYCWMLAAALSGRYAERRVLSFLLVLFLWVFGSVGFYFLKYRPASGASSNT